MHQPEEEVLKMILATESDGKSYLGFRAVRLNANFDLWTFQALLDDGTLGIYLIERHRIIVLL